MKSALYIAAAIFVLALAKPAKPLQAVITEVDGHIPLVTTAATKTPASQIQGRAWFVEMVEFPK